MKIRTDFVTNSSSSCFVLCNKAIIDMDKFCSYLSDAYDEVDDYAFYPTDFIEEAETKEDVLRMLEEKLRSDEIIYFGQFLERGHYDDPDLIIQLLSKACNNAGNDIVKYCDDEKNLPFGSQ